MSDDDAVSDPAGSSTPAGRGDAVLDAVARDDADDAAAKAAPSKRPLLLLVDGSSYLYRAYHAMPDLRGPDGVPTGAIHGMVAMMRRLREQYPAEHAACVFDAPGGSFRDEWYPAYKANRSAMPEPLAAQVASIHEVVRLLGWPVLTVPGVEADDAIGTLARTAVAAGHDVLVSTGDKDLAQLVGDHVALVNTMTRRAARRGRRAGQVRRAAASASSTG